MNTNYGSDLEQYLNKKDIILRMLAQYLNNGHLSLLLGSGVSKAIELPDWLKLVQDICNEFLPGEMIPGKTYLGNELKDFIQSAKTKIGSQEDYLKAVQKHLYNGVDFDFGLARKDLLIALSALIVGRNRGNVNNIITYNFDSVLEWYLDLLGLKVDSFTKKQFISKSADVTIAHIHGYLPHDNKEYGKNSDDIVFSIEEFQDRMVSSNYWKEYFYEFFRRHTFLSIGMSADSLYNDVCPYLREMDAWYTRESVTRLLPYGIAFLSPGNETDKRLDTLLTHGIIPCVLEHSDMPPSIFKIVQNALKSRK